MLCNVSQLVLIQIYCAHSHMLKLAGHQQAGALVRASAAGSAMPLEDQVGRHQWGIPEITLFAGLSGTKGQEGGA